MPDRERYAFTSQLAVFRACPEIMSRLLKRGGSVLIVAKILVISRLLHKKLSRDQRSIAYVESTRIRLARLRQILLANIDKRLKDLAVQTAAIIDTMCAFSLATSSSATDVLRHYHQIRYEAILAKMKERQENGENVLQALQLWVQTIETTEAIIPRQLSSALLKLKATSLFSNDDIRAIDEMDHEVHDKWIGEDITNFTPYVRHDDLQALKASEQLANWASSTLSRFQESISSLLESLEDPTAIVHLRKRTLDLWFSYHNRIKGIDRSSVLDGLRKAFTSRLLSLIQTKCYELSEITVRIRATLQGWQRESLDGNSSLWDDDILSMNASSGAQFSLSKLEYTVYGRTGQIRMILQEYQRWLDDIEGTRKIIDDLRRTRWEEDLDSLDDDDELIDQRQRLLSEVDPQKLTSSVMSDLSQAFTNLQYDFDEIVANLRNGDDRSSKDVFLLRLLRDFTQRLPQGVRLDYSFAKPIRGLQGSVATTVIETSIRSCRTRIEKAITGGRVPQRSLWEGTPELPNSPSPWTFKLLQVLATTLAGVGSDIWTNQAMLLLKERFRAAFVEELSSLNAFINDLGAKDSGDRTNSQQDAMIDPNEQVPNGDTHMHLASNSPSNARADFNIQQAFDLAYLDNATQAAVKQESKDSLASLREIHQSKISLSKMEIQRLEKGAADYWKRTALLFAFLA